MVTDTKRCRCSCHGDSGHPPIPAGTRDCVSEISSEVLPRLDRVGPSDPGRRGGRGGRRRGIGVTNVSRTVSADARPLHRTPSSDPTDSRKTTPRLGRTKVRGTGTPTRQRDPRVRTRASRTQTRTDRYSSRTTLRCPSTSDPPPTYQGRPTQAPDLESDTPPLGHHGTSTAKTRIVLLPVLSLSDWMKVLDGLRD